MTSRRLGLVLAALLFGVGSTSGADTEPMSGRQIYEQFCYQCHGTGADAAPGVDLSHERTAELRNPKLVEIITHGRPDRGMPAFESVLSPQQIRTVVFHLRVRQNRPELRVTEAPGTAREPGESARLARGLALFRGKARCHECHSVREEGGLTGPALDQIARRLSPEEIRTAIVRPSESIAEGYGAVVLVTASGERIRGRARKQTAETLQLLDESGELWTTYFKRELDSLEPAVESLMPADLLDALSETEMGDLLAFLSSLGNTARKTHSERAATGKELYSRLECAGCHESAALPGMLVHPLSGLGARYDVETLSAYLAAPKPPMPSFALPLEQRRELAHFVLKRFP